MNDGITNYNIIEVIEEQIASLKAQVEIAKNIELAKSKTRDELLVHEEINDFLDDYIRSCTIKITSLESELHKFKIKCN